MKNLMKKSLFVIAFLTVSIAMANINDNDPRVKVNIIETKLMKLTLTGNTEMFEVTVKDSYGYQLHTEKLNSLDYSKKYDLTNLPNGNYTMEFESKSRIKVVPFRVSSSAIVLNNSEEVVYFKPMVRKVEDDVFVSMLALNNENLEILLYDEDNNLLYTDILKNSRNLDRKFNLSNLRSGDYSMVLRTNGRTFYETIKL